MNSYLVFAVLIVANAQGGVLPGLKLLPIVKPSNTRIVGGFETTINNVPYIVAILFNERHGCGGSIISPNVILTAAHCLDSVTPSRTSIRTGSTYKSSGGQVIQVKNFTQHENYSMGNFNHDIAVMFLSSSITLSQSSKVISMISQDQIVMTGVLARTSGWGTTQFGLQQFPEALRTVIVPIVDQNICKQAYGTFLTDGMICAGLVGVGGKDACQNDSGGPLEVGDILVGVVSFGTGCAHKDYPGVYTKISNYKNFVDGNMK